MLTSLKKRLAYLESRKEKSTEWEIYSKRCDEMRRAGENGDYSTKEGKELLKQLEFYLPAFSEALELELTLEDICDALKIKNQGVVIP